MIYSELLVFMIGLVMAFISSIVLYVATNESVTSTFRFFLMCITGFLGTQFLHWCVDYFVAVANGTYDNVQQSDTQQTPSEENAAPRRRVRDVDPSLVPYLDRRRLVPVAVDNSEWNTHDGQFQSTTIFFVRRDVDNSEAES